MVTTLVVVLSRRRVASTLRPGSHGLELVDALLGVALADLPQGFVFVSSRLDVLGVQHVVLRLLGVVAGLGQLRAQSLGGRTVSVSFILSVTKFGL